jgi:zinc protease
MPGSPLPRRIALLQALLALLVIPLRARADAPQAAPTTAPTVQRIEYTQETLPNGLRVIYAPLRQAPVVHVRVLYHVGSRDERPDRQGFAHMFEHMMFRGSAHVAPEEHMKRVGTVGGYSNAFTSFDQTVYVNTVPSQHLPMALWLEADRMASFKVSEEIYKTERKVVAEEWRMQRNRPYGTMYEDFLKNAYLKHSYRWTPIGNMEHLRNAEVSELQEFFNTFYVPNNAVLVIAGDFELDDARKLVRDYYAWIPKGAAVERGTPAEPEQTSPRDATVPQVVPLPAVLIGYKVPEYASDDHYPLSLLSTILGGGRSSRLANLLVNAADPLAVDAGSFHMQLQDSGVFVTNATTLRGEDPAVVRQVLEKAVADVVANGVTADELAKAKTLAKLSQIQNLQTADNLADQLGDEALLADDPERANTMLAKFEAVTLDGVRRVAGQYLRPERATALLIKPDPMAAMRAAATQIAAAEAAAKGADVAPATRPVQTRVVEFPKSYPTTAPTADARQNPEFEKGTESMVNGVRVIVMPDPRLPLVNFGLTMRRGSHSDPKGKDGLGSLTAELVRRGAGGLSYTQLNEDLEARGISLYVADGGDHTKLNGSSTTDQLEHLFKRARQVLHEPALPADEFEKLKVQTINQLALSLEQPGTAAGRDLAYALYGDSPLGTSPTPASVASITLDDVKGYHRTIYRPNDAIFVISGDVTVERGRELAKQLLDGWEPAAELPAVDYTLPSPPTRRRVILIDRPDAKQSTVRMGIPAYTIKSDEKFPGSIAGQILTAGIDSRLGKYVRAEKGLAYSVSGSFSPGRHAGSFGGGTDTAIETTADAIEAMFKVFDDMRREEVTPVELTDAKKRVAGSMVMSMQTIGQHAGFRVDGILNDYPIDYYDKYPARIAQVGAGQVRDVLGKYVKDDEMTIVVVAPAEKVKEQLGRLGVVEVVPMPAKRPGVFPATQPAAAPATQEAPRKAA